MTMTSVGYDGSVDEVAWANLAPTLGTLHGIEGYGDLAATVVTGQDRKVSIATGKAFGWGVRDTVTVAEVVQLPVVASGTRWDTVVLRRDWQPSGGGPSSIVYVTGTTTQVVASGLLSSPGVQADQPLALVQITAGQQLPTALVDLRTWPSQIITANAIPPAGLYRNGAVLRVAGHEYQRVPASGGSWLDLDALTWLPFAHLSTLTDSFAASQYAKRRGVVFMRGDLKRVNGESLAPADVSRKLGTLPLGYRPSSTTIFPVATTFSYSANGGRMMIETDGSVTVTFAQETLSTRIDCSFPVVI